MRWNQLDIGIALLSVIGIGLEEVEGRTFIINPTLIRVMRVLRIARVLKLLKMAKGIRSLLNTVMQALPQVGNLGLLFFLLFFIFAALGVELFGRLGRCKVWIIVEKVNNSKVLNLTLIFLVFQTYCFYLESVTRSTPARDWGNTLTSGHSEWPSSHSSGSPRGTTGTGS